MLSSADTDWVISQTKQLGFDLCGVLPISNDDRSEVSADVENLAEWLGRGYAGEMRYLSDPRRAQLGRVMPEARSVIVCALNYNADQPYSIHAAAQSAAAGAEDDAPRGWLARYAWGDDYHLVVGEKLEELVAVLRARFGQDFLARPYVDTGPVVERAAARDAGLGWLGKNTCLINDAVGSWLFLGVVLTSLDLPTITGTVPIPAPDLCGNCSLCLDACPTGALVEPYVLDARRCISYLTIELRGAIPEEMRRGMGWQVFGCDICQDVCPWNRNAPVTPVAAFEPHQKLFAPELHWLLSLSEEQFRATFHASAVRRTKWRGLVRNACIAAGNAAPSLNEQQRARLRVLLSGLVASGDALLSEHANWAIDRLRDE